MIRQEVADLVARPLPPEDVPQEEIDQARGRLEAITPEVSVEEAVSLAHAFPPDDETCYGLAWTLVHLIETAPGGGPRRFEAGSSPYWIEVLNGRIQAADDLP